MTRVPMTDRLEKALETLLGRATPYELAYMVGTEEYRELQAAYREAARCPTRPRWRPRRSRRRGRSLQSSISVSAVIPTRPCSTPCGASKTPSTPSTQRGSRRPRRGRLRRTTGVPGTALTWLRG